MLKIVIFFLKKYISSPKKEWFRFDSVFMVMGIILSVATLTIALAIFQGYETALKKTILGANSHIYFFKNGNSELTSEDINKIKAKLKQKKEVKAAAGIILTNAMLSNKKRVKGAIVRGIDWKLTDQPTEYRKFVFKGDFKLEEKNDAVLGEKLAHILNVSVGDTIQLISPINAKITSFGMKNKQERFRIVGLYRSGMYEYDSKYVFLNISKAMDFAGLKNEYSILEVKLSDDFIEKADYLAYLWENEFDQDYQISSWIDFNGNLFALLKLEKWVIFIILSFLVLIASFNVISAVSTAIIEKKKEIGIIKAFGASDQLLKKIFIGKTMVISVMAIFVGEIIGMIFSILLEKQDFFTLKGDVYFLEKINITFEPFNLFLTFFISLFIVFLAGSIPLRKITKLEITEIIQ